MSGSDAPSSPTKKQRADMSIPTVALATGAAMPIVGLGTWKSKPGQVEAAVKAALDVGYRHIDCAAVYGNETEVGSAIKEKIADGTVKREDIFITSKLWNTKHRKADVEPALKKTLADLQLDYIDLYLIHWPHGFEAGDNPFPKNEDGTVRYDYTSYLETWEALEACVDAGLTKAIGLSNFNSQQIKEICDKARIKPAVLQVEVHPYMNQEALIGKAKAMGLAVTAYSPLGSPDRPWAKEGEPTLLDDPKIVDMAKKYNKSPAQICLKFQVQRGVIVIPKSVTPSRIKENSELFDFELSDEDMATIKAFNRPWRACVPMLDGKPRDAAHPLYPFNLDEDAA